MYQHILFQTLTFMCVGLPELSMCMLVSQVQDISPLIKGILQKGGGEFLRQSLCSVLIYIQANLILM